MKSKFSVLLATLALVLSANTQAAENTDAHHHHDHGSASPQQLQLNAGKKWATDAHLRQAMNDINQAMAKALPLIHKNQFGDQAYQALATTVSQKVALYRRALQIGAESRRHAPSGHRRPDGRRRDDGRENGELAS